MPNLYQKNHTFSQWSTGGAYLHFLYEAGLYNYLNLYEKELNFQ